MRPAAEVIMMGLSAVHMLIFGIVAVLLLGHRLPSVGKSLRQSLREFQTGLRELQDQFSNRDQQRGPVMREHFKKFLWTSKFWALLGLIGLVSGLYFQRVAANGSGLWCLGLMFLGAAYLEQQE
jgi:Sec-independent protein translocase protein TatA